MMILLVLDFISSIDGFRGEGGKSPPPEAEKIVVENVVISEGSIFSNKFSKNNFKNAIFLLNFHQKSSKFSQNFPTICVFRPNGEK